MGASIDIIQYAIVCPLVFLAGIIDAIAGGGGLISVPAYLIAGLPPHDALGTNKMSSCMGTAIATYRYVSEGYAPMKLSLMCAAFGLAASFVGANLTLLLSEHALRMALVVILPATAAYVMRPKTMSDDREPLSPRRTAVSAVCIASAVGAYDGFYGPGTGTFLMLLLNSVAHLRLRTANGVTKVINLSTNVAALAVMLANDKALMPLGLAAGAFSIAGNYIGARLFDRIGTRIARPVIILVLSIFFARTIWQLMT